MSDIVDIFLPGFLVQRAEDHGTANAETRQQFRKIGDVVSGGHEHQQRHFEFEEVVDEEYDGVLAVVLSHVQVDCLVMGISVIEGKNEKMMMKITMGKFTVYFSFKMAEIWIA